MCVLILVCMERRKAILWYHLPLCKITVCTYIAIQDERQLLGYHLRWHCQDQSTMLGLDSMSQAHWHLQACSTSCPVCTSLEDNLLQLQLIERKKNAYVMKNLHTWSNCENHQCSCTFVTWEIFYPREDSDLVCYKEVSTRIESRPNLIHLVPIFGQILKKNNSLLFWLTFFDENETLCWNLHAHGTNSWKFKKMDP